MRRNSKARSLTPAASAGTSRARRTIFGMACVCVLGLVAFLGSSASTAGAAEECPNAGALGVGFLPECRAWEMVSPPDKNGGDVMGDTSRVRSAASELSGLPMAVTFPSLSGFVDAVGSGVSFEYLAQRTGGSDTGWVTHAITPRQEPLSASAALAFYLQPQYEGDLSADLTQGVFRAWSPLSPEPNIKDVENLYLRTDLRSPGKGTYRLLTDSTSPLPPLATNGARSERPFLDGASEDFERVTFESYFNLTPDASGANQKLYKTDASGTPRLITAGSTACPGGVSSTSPCSMAGRGASAERRNPGAISADGSRVFFSSPITTTGGAFGKGAGGLNTKAGVTTKLFQLDDQGTTSVGDDATIQVNTSEKAVPDIARAATFHAGSRDGDRVFFSSDEQLTDTPGSGIYLWARQDTDERQRVVVDATGGTFTLTAHSEPTVGSGNVTESSTNVAAVQGSFSVGQVVTGTGIQPGTTITSLGTFSGPASNSKFTLSKPATASESGVALQASRQATTAALPYDATPSQLQAALEALSLIGTGNVTVSGGPGAGGYDITFGGALAGVNVAQLTADASALTGGAASATVSTPNPVLNLSLIGPGANGFVGMSADGHRAYFLSTEATMGGALPPGALNRMYYWQDASGSGSLSVVGDISTQAGQQNILDFTTITASSADGYGYARVTPDGKALLFTSEVGTFLPPGYQHGSCDAASGCTEIYLYDADQSSPLAPHVVCASCNLAVPGENNQVSINQLFGQGGSFFTEHRNRAISDDGRFVFFTTPERLTAEDSNGVKDAYVYDATTGVRRLLSSGKDSSASYFMDISSDGKDAFFITAEQLSGWDVDGNYDLYDARVQGGFPEPPPQPASCLGDGCQPAPATVGESVAASGVYSGPASDPPPRKPCRKGYRRVIRGGKSICVKRGKHHRTNKSGRASR